MVLGAGIYQVPLISLVGKMGVETIVVSPRGDFPGIPLSDIHLDIDITDTDRVVNAAKEYGISGIVTTGTDAGIPAMGAVADAMDLKGPSRRVAETASVKTAFRCFQKENGFNHPSYKVCSCSSDIWVFLQEVKKKIVIKPDDSSGSRGVTVIEPRATREKVESSYRNARQFSRNGRICAELFVEGSNFGGAAFLSDGHFRFFTPTRKHMVGPVVQGHSIPSGLCDDYASILRKEILDTALKLGYFDGPLDFDVVLHGREVTILEIGLRLGGNGIVDCIEDSTGTNLLEWILIYISGGSLPGIDCCHPNTVSSYVFGAEYPGRLGSVPDIQEIKRAVPEVKNMVMAKKTGDYVQPLSHNANLVGYFVLRCGEKRYMEVLAKVNRVFQLDVEESLASDSGY